VSSAFEKAAARVRRIAEQEADRRQGIERFRVVDNDPVVLEPFGSGRGYLREGDEDFEVARRVKSALVVGDSAFVLTDRDGDRMLVNSTGPGVDPATPHTHAQADVTGLVADLAAKQPIDSDLTAIAALATTSYGRSLLILADAAAARTAIGAAPTSHTHAQADVTSLVADLAGKQPIDSDLTAIAALATTAFGRSLLTSADAAAVRSTIGAAPTSHTHAQADITSLVSDLAARQPLDSDLTSIAALTTTAYGRALLTLADAAAARTNIGAAATSHTHAQADITSLVSDLTLKANLASPTFSGTPSLPTGATGVTQSPGNNTTRFATTEFVTAMAALKADLASPTFTGTPVLPTGTTGITQTAGNDSTRLATTAFVAAMATLKANLASPTFTGTPSLPTGTTGITQSPGNNTTALATTAFVAAMAALKADLASPVFTGDPRAPTPATADNDTSIATTAYVKAQLPTYETSLPGAPFDGQEIFYAAVPADGVIWHLRYRTAASGSYKWEFVGGSDMYHAVNTGQGTAATHSTFQDLATVGPTITVPLAGDYMIEFSCQGYGPGAGDFGRAAVKIGAAAALDADTVFQTQQGANNSITGGNRIRLPAVAVSTVLKIQYRSFSNVQSFYQERRMLIRPIRVG